MDASTVDFSDVNPDATSYVLGDTDMGTIGNATIQNQGNVVIDIGMNGTDLTGSAGTITVGNAAYRFDTGSYISFTGSKETEDVNVPVGATEYNKIDFELYVPVGTASGSYSGTVTVTAETNT